MNSSNYLQNLGDCNNLIEIYNKVLNSKTFEQRAAQGNSSIVVDAGGGWIRKRDKPGIDLVGREFKILTALQDLDLRICPEVDLDYGCPDEFLIQKVNNGATLEEYILEFVVSHFDIDLLSKLLKKIAVQLNTFWNNGYVHGDLHLNNIVVDIEKGGRIWDPYLIDFGYSFHQDNPPEFWELQTIIKDQNDDKEWLLHSLCTIAKDDEDIMELIYEFEDDLIA